MQAKKVLIVAHKGTHEATNTIIFNIMNHTSFQISILEFDDEKLIPDEKAVGRILMTLERDTDGIISVGSGTINDLNRLIGSRVKIPAHVITVGIGTLIITILYKYTLESHEFKKLENSQNIEKFVKEYLPKESEIILWLKTIGLSCNVKDYGIDEKLLREIILKAGYIRDRYTIFMLLDSLELLDIAADYLSDYFFNYS